jgi:hypothetical protein
VDFLKKERDDRLTAFDDAWMATSASDTEKLKFDDSDEAPFDDSRQMRTLQLPTTPSPD